MRFSIGNHRLEEDQCYIIAEIGSNHDGDKGRAFQMIRCAAEAGANAVKFQLFKADSIAADVDFPETMLTDQFSKFGRNTYNLYAGMELPESWLHELKACCDENHVDFLATPFDEDSADKLVDLGVSAIKVASFEITHIPLLKHLSKLSLPLLLSTGMANLGEIETAVNTIKGAGEQRIALFHCGIGYPAPFETVNLRCMETLRSAFDCPVGYSDHTEGIVVPVAAVSLGAAILEKHVTMPGGKSPDHNFALSMEEFAEMVSAVRRCEAAMGCSLKGVQENEVKHLLRGRRSLFVVKDMAKGEEFSRENLSVLRPGIGIAPGKYESILGKKSMSDIKAPALLKEGDWF